MALTLNFKNGKPDFKNGKPGNWEMSVRQLPRASPIRVGQILSAIGFDQSQRSTRNERRVTDILQRLGWRRDTKKDADGNISWVPYS